jgi:hypothetical protein
MDALASLTSDQQRDHAGNAMIIIRGKQTQLGHRGMSFGATSRTNAGRSTGIV